MIKITIIKNKGVYQKLRFQGHALYDDYGKDIVCAGVSSILITTVNAILKYKKEAIEYETQKDVIINILKIDEIINLLLDNMVELLKELEQQYPKNITIREDEKYE